MRISLVTPSLNQAAFLEETIRSILLQGYANLQYIVIDAGSRDGSVDIIKKYAPWIDYWVSEPDRGQSHAINKGLALCDGEWFNWINSDDCLWPGALAEVSRIASATTAVVSGAEVTGATLQSSRPLGRTKFAATLEETFVEHHICQQGLFLRTALVKSLGGVREEFSCIMDLDLLVRVLLDVGLESVAETSAVLAFFRQHEEAKTTKFADKFKDEERALFRSLAAAAGIDPRLMPYLETASPIAPLAANPARLDRDRFAETLARKFWWNAVVEPAWQSREFTRFRQEAARFAAAFPHATGPRIDRLQRLASLPDGILWLLSLFRSDRPRHNSGRQPLD